MNRIDEIKREITEERLRNGWDFVMNNFKKFKAGNTEFRKCMSVKFHKEENRFCASYVDKFEDDFLSNMFISKEYKSTIDFIIEIIQEEKDLELHEMNRNY